MKFFRKEGDHTPTRVSNSHAACAKPSSMSNISMKDVLRMLDSLASNRELGGDGKSLPLKKAATQSTLDESSDKTNRFGLSASEQCDSEELQAAQVRSLSSAQNDRNASHAVASSVSGDILRIWRNIGSDTMASPKEIHAATSQSDVPAQTTTRGYTDATTSAAPDLFQSLLRAPSLESVRPLTGLPMQAEQGAQRTHAPAQTAAACMRALDAAALLFPDAVEITELSDGRTLQLPVHVPSTIVHRVIRTLTGTQLRVLHDEQLEPYYATVAMSNDGQEVLWQRGSAIMAVNASWCSFFIREVKDLNLGDSVMSQGFRATCAHDCVFCVNLTGRVLAFEAESPHLRQLWLVGLLALLESAASLVSTVRIWRSLAPRLLLSRTDANAAPTQLLTARKFSPSVERFMDGMLEEQESAAPDCSMSDDPLMTGTFLRRVECSECVVFMLTSVTLGEHGVALADPESSLTFASCDFRKLGITRNSLRFVTKSGLECVGDNSQSNHPEQMTPCVEIKDSFGARHLIVMPSQDVSRAWEDGVQHVKAFPQNATSDRDQSIEAIGGIRDLLKSLDHVTTKADWLQHNGNTFHGENVESVNAQAHRPSAILQQVLKGSGAQEVVLSSGSSKPSKSILKTQWPLSLEERIHSTVANERHAVPSIDQRVEESPPYAAAWSDRDRFVPPQKHYAAQSPLNSSINSSRFQLKAQIAGHLQSLEDDHEIVPVPADSLQATSRMRNSSSTKRHQAVLAPRAFLRHEYNNSDNTTAPGRSDVLPSLSHSTSPSLPLSRYLSRPGGRGVDVVDEDASGAISPSAAGDVMVGLAARINGALTAFANFGNK